LGVVLARHHSVPTPLVKLRARSYAFAIAVCKAAHLRIRGGLGVGPRQCTFRALNAQPAFVIGDFFLSGAFFWSMNLPVLRVPLDPSHFAHDLGSSNST
jgi:hypothetical protein